VERCVENHVIPSWMKSFARSTWCLFTFMPRGKVAVAMAHTLVSPFGTLNADTICVCLFVCLFCNVGIKVVERCQFRWVRDSLRLLAVAPRGLSVFRRGSVYILLTFKVKASIQTIARFLIIRARISGQTRFRT